MTAKWSRSNGILGDPLEGVEAANSDGDPVVTQLLDRWREAFGDMALLGYAGLLVRRARLAMRTPCTDRADDERAERDGRQPQIAEDLAARGAVAAFLPVRKRENGRRQQSYHAYTSDSQDNQARNQIVSSGHAVNLTENRDGRQGAAGGAATSAQARRCWRGRAILEAA